MSAPVLATALSALELQRLWFATLTSDWSSLVVVPAHPGGAAIGVAQGLVQIAALHKHRPIKLIRGEGVDLQTVSFLLVELSNHVATGGMAIVVLDSLVSNPAGIPVARAADAALLCVQIGETDFKSGERTVELLGASRILGAVTLDARSQPHL